jgi:hypothetical protein
MAYVWGVDSASPVNNQLYQCVLNDFGKPRFWGRYLSTVPRAADGLTDEEITFLHRQSIKILPIYNDFRNAVGYANGKLVARNAAGHALVDTIRTSGFKSGIYHDPIRGAFSRAFCQAVKRDYRVKNETALWSAEPETPTTNAQQAPTFSPYKPRCNGNVWAWQYGRDAKVCPIDTNVIDSRLFNQLF